MRLLIATANPNTRFAVDLLVSQEPNTHVVATASDMEGLMALLGVVNPDIVIADWALPGQPMQTLLTHQSDPIPPFIILSQDDVARPIALRAGAAAFVVTGSRPDSLIQAYRTVREHLSTEQRSKIYDEQEQQ